MDSQIVTAIIAAVAGVAAAIIGRLPSPQTNNSRQKNKKNSPYTWRRFYFSILSIVLIAAGLIMFCVAVYNNSEEDITDPAGTETQEIVKSESYTVTESTAANVTKPDYTTPTEVTAAPYVEIGSIREIGQFEQDDIDLNGPEDIKWIALEQDNNKVLIISISGLHSLPYYKGEGTSDWESSSIRHWLNGTFYQNAFSDDEKENIITEPVKQHENDSYPDCEQGDETTDTVFLLSLEEYTQYMYKRVEIDDKYRKGIPSACVADELKESIEDGTYWWWLRTSARYNTHACAVTGHGEINDGNTSIQSVGLVRPAMWVRSDWWNELQ